MAASSPDGAARPRIQATPGGKTPVPRREEIQSFEPPPGENNSVVPAKIIQSFHSDNQAKTTELSGRKTTEKPKRDHADEDDDWRFEIKRKRRDAGRKNTGSTAKKDYYYWVIRVRKYDGATLYYGTLDVLDADNPQRLAKYWQRSRKRKVGKNA